MRAKMLRTFAQSGGTGINAASILAIVAARDAAAYCAAKHAVVGLTRAAAPDYAAAGLRVNAVCPGYTRTPMIDRVIDRDPEAEGRMVMTEPIGRL